MCPTLHDIINTFYTGFHAAYLLNVDYGRLPSEEIGGSVRRLQVAENPVRRPTPEMQLLPSPRLRLYLSIRARATSDQV